MTDAEKSIIGCALIDPDTHEKIFARLSANAFSSEPGKVIFADMKRLYKSTSEVDIVTLSDKKNKEYKDVLVHCMQITPTTSNYLSYIQIAIDDYRIRAIQENLLDINNSVADGETADAITQKIALSLEFQQKISTLQDQSSAKDFDDAISEYLSLLGTQKAKTYKSGYSKFDFLLGGFEKGLVYVLSARSGMGKTDFAINLACKLAKSCKVDYYSLEVKRTKLIERIVSKITKINSTKLRDRTISTDEWVSIAERVDNLLKSISLKIDDNTDYSIEEIEGFIIKNKPDVVFIDHIGLLKMEKTKQKWEAVAQLSQSIMKLAKKYNCCMVLLVQQNSDKEKRGKGSASLSDLKGSDNIGNDASVVMFINAEKRDKPCTDDQFFLATVDIVKNRDGLTGKSYFNWYPQYHNYIERVDSY